MTLNFKNVELCCQKCAKFIERKTVIHSSNTGSLLRLVCVCVCAHLYVCGFTQGPLNTGTGCDTCSHILSLELWDSSPWLLARSGKGIIPIKLALHKHPFRGLD